MSDEDKIKAIQNVNTKHDKHHKHDKSDKHHKSDKPEWILLQARDKNISYISMHCNIE